jgi:hypothetical protein
LKKLQVRRRVDVLFFWQQRGRVGTGTCCSPKLGIDVKKTNQGRRTRAARGSTQGRRLRPPGPRQMPRINRGTVVYSGFRPTSSGYQVHLSLGCLLQVQISDGMGIQHKHMDVSLLVSLAIICSCCAGTQGTCPYVQQDGPIKLKKLQVRRVDVFFFFFFFGSRWGE